MTTLREAAQQALEALEGGAESWQRVGPAIDALRAALAEPVQEPDDPQRRCGGPGCDMRCCQPAQEAASKMTAGRAAYFMARFKREEKMLGPNEQAALDFVISMLEAALAEPVLQTCNCRWDGEVQVQQCTLHEAHVDAIHEWAERAKTAEKKLAALAEPVQDHFPDATKMVQEPVACLIGTKGSAFDSPTTKRAYTYAEQPGNVVASRLGLACNAAASQSAGDSIDRGLGLLQELQRQGFGVFDLGAEYTSPPQRPAEPVQEPVAWRWGYRSVTTGEMDWRGYVEIPAHPNLRSPEIIMEPLYAAPPQRPAEPAQEPVYLEVCCDAHPKWMRVNQRQFDEYVAHGWEGRRLYTTPPQRRPLSDADLAKIWDDALDQLDPRDQLRFIARAIERAHGIGGEG